MLRFAVERDALRPDILEGKIINAIESEIDIEVFNEQVWIHNVEFDKLNNLKADVEQYIKQG